MMCPRKETVLADNTLYDPPAGLDEFELTVIGQALTDDVSRAAKELAELWPGIVDACREHAKDPQEVIDCERATLRRRYDVMCRFVVDPLPFELFTRRLDEAVTAANT